MKNQELARAEFDPDEIYAAEQLAEKKAAVKYRVNRGHESEDEVDVEEWSHK